MMPTPLRNALTAPFAGCAAALALALLAGCGGAESRRSSHVERGREYFAHEDFLKASIEFRNAMQIAPRDPQARLLAGMAAEKTGRWRDAAGLYQSVIDLAPDNVDATAGLARLYGLGGAPDQALKLVEPALAKHPDSAALLVVRALARSKLKDPEGALADAQRAVQLAPEDENAVAALAALYRERGQDERAADLVSSTLEKRPASTDLRELLVAVYEGTGESDKAIGQLQRLIALKPGAARYRDELAQLYTRAHRLDDAERTLTDAVKAMPRSTEAKVALVNFVAGQHKRGQAEKTLSDFLAADPANETLRLALGALLEGDGSADAALAAYNEVIRREGSGPTAVLARDRIAAVHLRQGRAADAEGLIAAVLRESPRDPDALRMRGEMELVRNDSAAAVADFRAVVRDAPAAVAVRRQLARALVANQQPALAEDELRTALDIAPDDPTTREDLAQLYLESKRPDRAVAIWEDGVRRRPDDPVARQQLIRVYLATTDLAAARTAADDLITLRPRSAGGYYLAGLVAQAQKRHADAEKQMERALELQPDWLEPLVSLTRLQLERGRSAEAIVRVQSTLARYPGNANALELLGEAYLAAHDFSRAADALSRAANAAPTWWYPYRNLALAREALNDDAGTVAALKSGIQRMPDEPHLAVQLAAYDEGKGRVDDAIAVCDALYRTHPLPKVAASLALLLATYKNDQGSLDRARDVSAPFASSDDPALLDAYGWVHYKRGEVDKALPALERAAAKATDSKVIRYHLALAELRVGRRERARADLKSAVSGSDSFPGAADARAVLASLSGSVGGG